MMNKVCLLDCTLRDGGYINDWHWGINRARYIIEKVVKAGIEVIEIGFLRNIEQYDPQVTISGDINDLNMLLPDSTDGVIYAAMAMVSNYDLDNLKPYCGKGIELIRVTAHDYDIDTIYEYASRIQELGYKVSINPINIMGYSDEAILGIVRNVNRVKPYQFSIVDTFGSMNRKNMSRIVRMVDNNLDKSIRIGLHLHENMALSYCMAQDFIEMNIQRAITIDGSLMGMGRNPGNLPIELICDYANDSIGKNYNIDYLLDAIYDYVLPFKGHTEWGYTPEYYLSARYNLHRNYAEHYLKKGNLTTRDVNLLLSKIPTDKATVFDSQYADGIYEEYQNNNINDAGTFEKLKSIINDREVMIMCPGKTISIYKDRISDYIKINNPIVVAINFEPDELHCDFVFYTNNKRYSVSKHNIKEIITSNLRIKSAEYYVNYNSVCSAFEQGCNSMIMLLKLLLNIGVVKTSIVGADGYIMDDNYYDNALRNYEEHGSEFNRSVTNAIEKVGAYPIFLTPTLYAKSEWE